MTHMSIELVATISLVLALVGLSIVVLIVKAVSARSKAKGRKLPLRLGQLPLSDEEKKELAGPQTISKEKPMAWPVYFFPIPGNRKDAIHGWLERIKGRRAIIRLHNGKRIRRKMYLVYLMNGVALDVPPVREQKRLPATLPVEVTSEPIDEATTTMLELERKFEAVPAGVSAS